MLAMKVESDSRRIQKRIAAIQQQLSKLETMRPGCLSIQYRKPQEKAGAYYQLSYTYKMRSRTEYIPPELVPAIERELAQYKRFRELTAEWVDLSLELSRSKIDHWKQSRKSG